MSPAYMTPVDREAFELYSIVHWGKGQEYDAISAWYSMNPAVREGWVKLVKHVWRKIAKASRPQYGPRSEDC